MENGVLILSHIVEPLQQEDIKAWGVEGEPQKWVEIALAEFIERGVYQVERKPGDNFGH